MLVALVVPFSEGSAGDGWVWREEVKNCEIVFQLQGGLSSGWLAVPLGALEGPS